MIEIETRDEVARRVARDGSLVGCAIQGVDLGGIELESTNVTGTLFLGCRFSDTGEEDDVRRRGAVVFPTFEGLPYEPYRSRLYSVDELMAGYDDAGYTGTVDYRIYEHFSHARERGFDVTIDEALAQRIHDHGIDDALAEVVRESAGRGVVGIMGGHGTARSDPDFARVARVAWGLTRRGYLVATGGGPGIMEAGNLGAYFANFSDPSILDAAIAILSEADSYGGGHEVGTAEFETAVRAYVAAARRVIERFQTGVTAEDAAREYGRERVEPGGSLAIPTWFYGHEPSNLFSPWIAKYFANSIREDGLLAISTAGVVYAPGSAGTLQEVFMDLAQNHYATFHLRSPMVFLGSESYRNVASLIREFVHERGMETIYGDLIELVDEPEDVVRFIAEHPARRP